MSRTSARLLGALVLCCAALSAQEFRATISGRVYDASGAAVPKAKAQVSNAATNETTSAVTETSGSYTIPLLRPGNYSLSVSAPGFKQAVRDNIELQVGKVAGVDVTLEVGMTSETVEVTDEAALLETQTGSRGGVVNTQQVSEIPLNARNPFMLGAIMPGVTFNGAAIWQRPFDNGAIAEWSINGSKNSSNEFLMDGASNNGQMGNNNIAYVPIVDAVQEFNVQTNSYNAEYGHTGGGIFNVVLKSGSNTFHATGWEYGNGIFEGPGQDGQQPFQRINDAYVADWVSTLTPTLIFNVRGSYNRFIEKGFGRGNSGFDLKSLGLPSALVDPLPGPRYFGRWDYGYTSLGRYQGINIAAPVGTLMPVG